MANRPKIYPCMAAIHPIVAYSSRCQETRIIGTPSLFPSCLVAPKNFQKAALSCNACGHGTNSTCLNWKFTPSASGLPLFYWTTSKITMLGTNDLKKFQEWFGEFSSCSADLLAHARSGFLGKEILEEKEAQMHPVSHVIVYYHVLPITAETTYGNPVKSVIHPSWKMNAQTQEAKPLFSGLGSNMSFLNAYCWV